MPITEEMDAAVTRLIADYNDRLAAGSILRCLARSVHDLEGAGVKAGIAVAAEAMTRRRLESRLESRLGESAAVA